MHFGKVAQGRLGAHCGPFGTRRDDGSRHVRHDHPVWTQVFVGAAIPKVIYSLRGFEQPPFPAAKVRNVSKVGSQQGGLYRSWSYGSSTSVDSNRPFHFVEDRDPTSFSIVTRQVSSESPETYVGRRPTTGEHPHCALAHETAYARFNGRVHHIWTGDRHSRLATLGRE